MKHGKKLLAGALALCLTLGLAGCGGQQRQTEPAPSPSLPPKTEQTEASAPTEGGQEQTRPTEAVVYNDDWIGEFYAVEGSYVDGVGNTWAYSLHIPQLRDETPAAQAVNEEIRADFQPKIDEMQESIRTETSQTVGNIHWESHWDGGLVSLVVVEESLYGANYYSVYHYDFDRQEAPTGSQILQRLGVDPETFLGEVRRGAVQAFDQMYAYIDSGMSGYAGAFLAQLRAWTVGQVPRDVDALRFCPEGGNAFTAYLPIGSIAGAAFYTQPVPVTVPQTAGADGGVQTENGAFRARTLDGGRGLEVTDLGTGKAYPVLGCYGTYTRLELVELGQERRSYLAALTEKGNVEVVDLTGGLAFGTLCSSGPLIGIYNAVQIQGGTRTEDSGTWDTAFVLTEAGGQYDLLDFIQALSGSALKALTNTWTVSGQTRSYLLSAEESGACALTVQTADGTVTYDGTLTWLGMGDGGLVCGYVLTGPDGVDLRGTWYAVSDFSSLTLRPLSGEDVLGEPVWLQADWAAD